MPIVTLSKSMSKAAFGAWAGGAALGAVTGVMACGPRWNGAMVRDGAAWRDRVSCRLMDYLEC